MSTLSITKEKYLELKTLYDKALKLKEEDTNKLFFQFQGEHISIIKAKYLIGFLKGIYKE